MAIQVTCPSCQSTYQLSDGLQGKNVRCKKCGEVFRIGALAAPPSAPVILKPADAPSSIQSSPSLRQTPRPAAPARMVDEDYGPPPKRKGSSTAKILLIVFGSIAAVFLVICGGVVGLGYWATKATREKFEEIRSNVEANVPPPAIDMTIKPPSNLDEALGYLRDGNVSKRHAGAQWLARGPRDRARQDEVARALPALLNEPNPQTRLAGVKALSMWATREQVPTLIGLLNDDDAASAEQRQIAIQTLGRLRDERAVEPLAQRLTNFFDREHAAKALQDMGPTAEGSVLKFYHHPDEATRSRARKILRSYHTKDDVILNQSIQDLRAPDPEYRKTVALWLCQTPVNEPRRKEIVEALKPLLTDGTPEVRLNGLKALAIWGPPENVPAIIRAVDDDSNEVRQSAMQTLARLKDPRGAEAVAGRLTNFFDRDLATRALQDIGPAAEKAVVKLYHHRDQDVRERARRLLQDYNTAQSVIMEQTASSLKSPEKELRINCANWLAQQQPLESNRKAVSTSLETLLKDSDHDVSIAGLKALKKWASKDNVPALLEVLKDDEFTPWAGEMRKLAMQTLGELKDERGVPAVTARLLNFFEREDAARALIAMGPVAEKAVLTGLTNNDAAVRKLVCTILAEIGTKASSTQLKRRARIDPDQNVAAAALIAARVIDARSAAAEKKEKETKPESAPAKDGKPEKSSEKSAPSKKS
ncbi:MAG TPA: HEAT repeat domain-containing protein [Gemmataceae bacterium]|nr:HEAT repeat domain-containing protein [Gemmataceae bacterium]